MQVRSHVRRGAASTERAALRCRCPATSEAVPLDNAPAAGVIGGSFRCEFTNQCLTPGFCLGDDVCIDLGEGVAQCVPATNACTAAEGFGGCFVSDAALDGSADAAATEAPAP